jgi:hypothetical protein
MLLGALLAGAGAVTRKRLDPERRAQLGALEARIAAEMAQAARLPKIREEMVRAARAQPEDTSAEARGAREMEAAQQTIVALSVDSRARDRLRREERSNRAWTRILAAVSLLCLILAGAFARRPPVS